MVGFERHSIVAAADLDICMSLDTAVDTAAVFAADRLLQAQAARVQRVHLLK